MLYVFLFLTFLLCYLVFLMLFMILYRRRLVLEERLLKINSNYTISAFDKRKMTFRERVVIPVIKGMTSAISSITPEAFRRGLEEKLMAADYPFGFGFEAWVIIKLHFYIVIPACFFMLVKFNDTKSMRGLMLCLAFSAASIFLPNTMLNEKIKNRNKKIVQQLPYALDLLAVSVEAGLSFDGALKQVIDNYRGELSREFFRVFQEIQLGKTRRQALENMANRCRVSDIVIFVSSMNQAEEMGISIGKVLKQQADEVRDKRRQRAREQAMKIPVKILFPVIFFILPTIFVVVLGPAVIMMSKFFGGR